MDPDKFEEEYEQDLVNRTQLGFTGFIDPETMTDADLERWYDQKFPSESSGSAARRSKKCQHDRCCGGFFCRDCFDDHNARNRLSGKPDQAWKGYCQHGVLYNTTNSCQEPQCRKTPRPYKKQSQVVAFAGNMGGGSKSYRKSDKKLKKKAKRSSKKAKRSSRKAKRSSRKATRSSRSRR